MLGCPAALLLRSGLTFGLVPINVCGVRLDRARLGHASGMTSLPELDERADDDERSTCHHDRVGNHVKPMDPIGWPATKLGEGTGQCSTNSEQDANPLPPEVNPPSPAATQVEHKHCQGQEPGSRKRNYTNERHDFAPSLARGAGHAARWVPLSV